MCPEALTKPIVVAIDGSPHSDAAVEWSARESVLRNARVQLIHVIAPMPEPWATRPTSRPPWTAGTATGRRDPHLRRAKFQRHWPTRRRRCRDHHTRHQSCRPHRRIGTGSTHRRRKPRLGNRRSATTRVRQHRPRPSRAVPRGRHSAGRTHSTTAEHRVLLGVDGTAASDEATALAFDEAARRGVDLLAVHAWSDVGIPPWSPRTGGTTARRRRPSCSSKTSIAGRRSIPACTWTGASCVTFRHTH